jgi:hypothetical protein
MLDISVTVSGQRNTKQEFLCLRHCRFITVAHANPRMEIMEGRINGRPLSPKPNIIVDAVRTVICRKHVRRIIIWRKTQRVRADGKTKRAGNAHIDRNQKTSDERTRTCTGTGTDVDRTIRLIFSISTDPFAVFLCSSLLSRFRRFRCCH